MSKSKLSFVWKAFRNVGDEMLWSLVVVMALTLGLSAIFYFAERAEQPEVFTCYKDALTWGYTRYIEGGDGVFEGAPSTFIGRIVASLLGFIGIAIVAIPAGLLGSAFIDAIAEEKRYKELEKYQKIMMREQNLNKGRNLQMYLKSLPQDESAWYYGCQFKFISNNVRLSKFLLKGIEMKDVLDVCQRYPQFRVKNRASALSSEEENKSDVYLLEHFPVNRRYGCFIDRGSKVTIISTSSRSELDTGNFSFYLAKWAGFNYISKDFDYDEEYAESYYNNPWIEPIIDGKRLKERLEAKETVTKDMRKLYEQKKAHRMAFLHDLESVTRGDDKWAICILSQVQNKGNDVDIHIAHNTESGKHETIHDMETFRRMFDALSSGLSPLDLSVEETTRYPLIHRGADKMRNLAYKLQEDGCGCNGLTMRVSSHLMEFDTNMRVALFIMAKSIKEVIEPEHPLPADDVKDMNRTGVGFMPGKEQNVDKVVQEFKFLVSD